MVKAMLDKIEDMLSESGDLLEKLRQIEGGHISVNVNRRYIWATFKDSKFKILAETKLCEFENMGMKMLTDAQTDELKKLIKDKMYTIPTILRHIEGEYTATLKNW